MKLIKKYRLGDRLAEEEPYWDETPDDFLNPNNLLKTSILESVPDFEEMGKWYARNPNAKGAAGGNRKANVVYADGENPGYYIVPLVKSNTTANWRETITPELKKFEGIPYNFGGKEDTYMRGETVDHNPKGKKHPERLYAGVDCSGFVLWFAKNYLGLNISGSAYDEYNLLKKMSGHEIIVKKNGKPVPFNPNDVLPGDVIYFGNKKHSARHIGIIHSVRNGKIYYTNAAGNDIAKICTIPIDDYVDSHANVFITSFRPDRNYNSFRKWLNPNNFDSNIEEIGENIVNYWDLLTNTKQNQKKTKNNNNKKSKKPKYNS